MMGSANTMQASRLLGTLLPSSPDLLPIINELRSKYGLREVFPDDDPIEEIFLDDEPVPLEDFHQETRSLVQAVPDPLPRETARISTFRMCGQVRTSKINWC
jgi:hypothetical protein